jgi:serine/threonine protein kinase
MSAFGMPCKTLNNRQSQPCLSPDSSLMITCFANCSVKAEWARSIKFAKTISTMRSKLFCQTASISTLLRFEREGSLTATVDKHPNIVSVHKLNLQFHAPYLVLDYVEGHCLDQLIKAEEPWVLEDIVALFRSLASTLDTMHKKGVFHRDLKPANILIRERDKAPPHH